MAENQKLALFGGEKIIMRSLAGWPQYDNREKDYLLGALNGSIACASQARAVGYTVSFEKEFARYHQRKFAVACFNCTVGLEAALAVADVGPTDEVLVPAYTFFATVSCVISVGAIPVFVDIDPKTICMDCSQLDKYCTKRTKAIIPVHFGGYLADMKKLQSWASARQVAVIEDAAQAHGSRREGEYAGAYTRGAVFSFQRNKNMCAGEGGMYLTDHEDAYHQFREFLWHGTKQGGVEGHHSFGSNLRITEFQSAILLGQLEKLGEQNKKRMRECDLLDHLMKNIPGFMPLDLEPLEVHARHLYMFRMDKNFWGKVTKNRLVEALKAEGVYCSLGYPYPLYRNSAFESQNYPKFYLRANKEAFKDGRLDFKKIHLPEVEKACSDLIIIPHFVFLSDFNIGEKIAAVLEKISENHKVLKRDKNEDQDS